MFLPPRNSPNIDQMAAEEFGEQQVQPTYSNAQDRENRILSSVENRLQKANYYRLVLESPLFNDGEGEAAYEVEAEFRNFALERLQILMGERPERSEVDLPDDVLQVLGGFSPLQLHVTKLWADKMLERDPSMAKNGPSPTPKVNVVQTAPAPPPTLNVVKSEVKKQRKRTPKIEPRKPSSLVVAAQQARQPVQPVVQQSVIQPRQRPQAQIPVQPVAMPSMPSPAEVLPHFQQPAAQPMPIVQQPPVVQVVQQPTIVQQTQEIVQSSPQPVFATVEENTQASANAQGSMTDHLGRSYEVREYVDHRTGEVKQHKVFHNSQVFPKGEILKQLYQVPNERAAILDLANKDTQGAAMVVRTGPNPWDKTSTSTAALGLNGAITHFQAKHRTVQEE